MSTLSQTHLHDETAAYRFVEAILWPSGPVCPRCKETKRLGKLNGKSTRIGVHKCYACRKPFNVKVGTRFEKSHIPLHKWLQAILLLCASKKGFSFYEEGRPVIHTNTVEGYFALFKRGMRGVYQHCKERHLHRYLAEFDVRYNARSALGGEDLERAERALRGVSGKRLTYKKSYARAKRCGANKGIAPSLPAMAKGANTPAARRKAKDF